jgi:hypothetical protein
MHIVVVFHLLMLVNYHQIVVDNDDDDDDVVVVVDYQDYVQMVKHKKLLDVVELKQQEDLDHNDQEFFSNEMVNL